MHHFTRAAGDPLQVPLVISALLEASDGRSAPIDTRTGECSGIAAAKAQAVQSSEGIALHQMLPLSLTFDYCAVTGGMAARFMRTVISDLETTA